MNNFIGGWYFNNTSICDKLIDFFKNLPEDEIYPGSTVSGFNKNVKDSNDYFLDLGHHWAGHYGKHLQKVVDGYIKKYPLCNQYSSWTVTEEIHIQHYNPNGGYYAWHTERACGKYPYNNRHLVFMTYLNDVSDAGETEFLHQKIKVKPEKGLTLIWPADWTFTHRGITSPTEHKYIITGWFNYY